MRHNNPAKSIFQKNRMHAVCKTLFLALLVSLVLFAIAFGTPVLSMFTSAKVLQWVGCTSAGFDNPAIRCGYGGGGVVGERFGPLSYWFTTLLAPYFLVRHFWDVMLGWLALILLFGGLATVSGKGKPALKRPAWPDTRPET
ncbi:hypothetical protein PMI15_01493 [Polaromonas sp. CF318]|nr:hypothetical protein PMI15_01493 [Polaromonas sp. CF318]